MKRLLQISLIVLLSLSMITLWDSCKKKPTPPIVTTSEVTEITRTTAATGGNVLSDGGAEIIVAGICWNTSPGVSVRNKHTNDGRDIGSFATLLTGLSPGTTYYINAYAHNSAGTGYGKEISFTTDPVVGATLTTAEVTSITTNSATSGGNITDDGGAPITARGVCWSTSQNPTTEDDKTSDGTGSGTFVSNMTELVPNTTYYLRAYATNSFGTTYGNEVMFTTLGQAPTAITEPACCITNTGATLNGSVNANYLSAEVTFEYGTTAEYGNSITAAQSPVTGNTPSSVSADLSGLIFGTTYHYRVVAVNSLGTSYGNDMEFTTLSLPPADDLVGYYPFTGNANDQTVNKNDGTVIEAVLTTDRFGNENCAYYFDGINDKITGPTNNWPLVNTSRTVSVWVKLSSLLCDGENNILFAYGPEIEHSLICLSFQFTEVNRKRIVFGGYLDDISYPYTYLVDTWYHITGTFDGTTAKLYLNGVLVAEENKSFWNTQSGDFFFGGRNDSTSFIKGTLDDIRIYKRALSADEVLLLYNETP